MATSAYTHLLAQVQRDSINAGMMTAEELAAELADPTTPLGSVTLQIKRWSFNDNVFEMTSPTGYSVTFESSVPFPVSNGAVIRFRPNIPVYFHYPVITTSSSKIQNRSGLGDISFDLAYGRRNASGVLIAVGIAATIPSATIDALGNDLFTLGPEMLIGVNQNWGVIGIFPNHEWKIMGEGRFSRTIIQPLISVFPGKGWTFGSNPELSYDWIREEWSVPWVFHIEKTSMVGSGTWRVAAEVNYFGKHQDAVIPEWMIGIDVTRVVSSWFVPMLSRNR